MLKVTAVVTSYQLDPASPDYAEKVTTLPVNAEIRGTFDRFF